MKKFSAMKKLILVFTGIFAICGVVISMTSAYFTSSKTVSGSITSGVLNVHLRSGTTDKDGNTSILSQTVLPGATVLKELNIYSANLNVPVLLRITMLVTTTLHGQLTVSNKASMPGSNWYLCSSSNTSASETTGTFTRYEWYYGSSLSAMTAVAASTITANTGLVIFSTTSNMKVATTQTSITSGDIYIAVDAIQATNATLTPTWFRTQIASRTAMTMLGD